MPEYAKKNDGLRFSASGKSSASAKKAKFTLDSGKSSGIILVKNKKAVLVGRRGGKNEILRFLRQRTFGRSGGVPQVRLSYRGVPRQCQFQFQPECHGDGRQNFYDFGLRSVGFCIPHSACVDDSFDGKRLPSFGKPRTDRRRVEGVYVAFLQPYSGYSVAVHEH